jgi:hypothetical protein
MMIDLKKVALTPQEAPPADVLAMIRTDLLAFAVLQRLGSQIDVRAQDDIELAERVQDSDILDRCRKTIETSVDESIKILSNPPEPVFFNSALMRRFLVELYDDATEQAREKDIDQLITYYATLGTDA